MGENVVILEEQIMNVKSELQLIQIAETNQEDSIAHKAMKILREKFDTTYKWCVDCDGAVVKENECCLNNISIEFKSGVEFDSNF
jgi:hypothetical protein